MNMLQSPKKKLNSGNSGSNRGTAKKAELKLSSTRKESRVTETEFQLLLREFAKS